MLNPLETTRRIDNAFLGYLRSSFGPRRPELRDAYHRALIEGGDLSRGPFVQATAPFKPGRSVDELIRAGVLSTGMRDLAESFPLDRPLHGHQEAAILKSDEYERNLVVSTGTGSGKTEAFIKGDVSRQERPDADAGLPETGSCGALFHRQHHRGGDPSAPMRRQHREPADVHVVVP